MDTALAHETGLLLLRASLAWVFLYAAWANMSTPAAWAWTQGESALFFPRAPEARRRRLGRVAAIVGMAMMVLGGASVLAGVEPRLGGLALAVFSLMGMRVHAIRREEARAAAGTAADPAMAWSAFGAHVAARLKNIALAGAGLFFVFSGAGRWVLSDRLGDWLGWGIA